MNNMRVSCNLQASKQNASYSAERPGGVAIGGAGRRRTHSARGSDAQRAQLGGQRPHMPRFTRPSCMCDPRGTLAGTAPFALHHLDLQARYPPLAGSIAELAGRPGRGDATTSIAALQLPMTAIYPILIGYTLQQPLIDRDDATPHAWLPSIQYYYLLLHS